ncbi:hypothetical protein G6L28_03700 [Agrobacterium larrymoorei]|uniref:hypothetical protein n=1 Tax=Agrobacterium larrymoorei TaxID=160699 RepID=UPI001573802F|nr:hypothetical protein [Agrobacterium larrymoorei]NTJ41704.1 hypothetical protein [Agrobacterium larrymoorei]
MNGFLVDAPYIAAIVGATAGLAVFGATYIKSMKVKIGFYDFAQQETDSALIAADRVLKNGATPEVIRTVLLCMLETLATPELGREFTEEFVTSKRRRGKSSSSSPLSEAMDKLHAQNPKLAADAHSALMGIILALPLMHADRIEISEATALEYAGEGATNPSSMFERASKALASFNKNGNGGFAAA